MQTAFPKMAAVLLTLCCVAFMGVGIVSYFGRPQPLALMAEPAVSNYEFASSTSAEGVSWTVAQRVGSEAGQAKRADSAYHALTQAYKMEQSRLNAETQDLTSRRQILVGENGEIATVTREQLLDVAAVKARIDGLVQDVAQKQADLKDKSETLQDTISRSTEKSIETSRTREDVLRLQGELNELRTDRYRLRQLQQLLTDRLVRLQLQNQALSERLVEFQAGDGSETTGN